MRARPAPVLALVGVLAAGSAIALEGAPTLDAAAWVGAGMAITLSLRSTRGDAARGLDELERAVMRCRRRGQAAWVLLAHVPASGRGQAQRLADCFRLTDSIAIAQTPTGYEVAGVFEDEGLDRQPIEQRLSAAGGALDTQIAWRRFPEDGVTLEALFDGARAALGDSTSIDTPAIVAPVLDRTPAPEPAETK